MALGVPLGALIGTRFGWRMTFVGVAGLAGLACCGLLVGMPRGIGAGLVVASLRERLAVVRQPGALTALAVTLLWAIGGYTVYTYIAPFSRRWPGSRARILAMRSSCGVPQPSPVSWSAVLPPIGSAGTASLPWRCRPWP